MGDEVELTLGPQRRSESQRVGSRVELSQASIETRDAEGSAGLEGLVIDSRRAEGCGGGVAPRSTRLLPAACYGKVRDEGRVGQGETAAMRASPGLKGGLPPAALTLHQRHPG